MSDMVLFVKKFLRHGTRVASVAPSSRRMAAELSRYIDPTRPQVVVELGAGTGAVTRRIVERKHPDSRVIAVELDPDFAARLRAAVPAGAEVLVADVTDMAGHMARLGISRVDVVVSGLPTPSLPAPVVEGVMGFVRRYAADAWFSQLTEFPWAVYGKFYRQHFGHVEYRRVPVNIPPGGAYHCRLSPHS